MSKAGGIGALGPVLKRARLAQGLSLRAVEGRTGIKSGPGIPPKFSATHVASQAPR